MTKLERLKLEQQKRAMVDLYKVALWHVGIGHSSVVKMIAELCVGAIKKEEALMIALDFNEQKWQENKEKVKQLFNSKGVIDFACKYKDILDFENHNSICLEIKDIKQQLKNGMESAWKGEGKFNTPIKDLYWVSKRMVRYVRNDMAKRFLYNPWQSNMSMCDLRKTFLRATRYTETNLRKKSKRYTVSRDEDKEKFYVSAKGRLAKIPVYKFKKYVKQGKIIDDHGEPRAKDDIVDGQYVKVGSYLQKHFYRIPARMKEQIQKAFEEIRPCHMVIDDNFEVAYNPIYNNHQDTDGDKASNYSCMSGGGELAQQFYGKIHGCKVVRWETDKGDQVGRCIMYEYNGQRHFVRIYGLYDYHRTMINMLLNEMKENDIFGRGYSIKDLELETDWTDQTKSMYLDGPYGVRRESGEDEQGVWYTKYKVVERGWDFDCKSTSHDTLDYEEDSYYTCEHCGERVHEDDVWWCGDNTYCCEECANADGWVRCSWCDEWEQEDDGVWVDGGEKFYCCEGCAESAGYRRCENCGEWHHRGEMIEINGEYYCCEDCAERQGWHECSHCGDWCDEERDCTIEIDGQYYCCEECALKDGWVKDGEEWKRVEDVEQVKEQEPEEPKEVVNEG